MEKKLGAMEEKLDAMEKKLGAMEGKLDAMEKKLGVMEEKLVHGDLNMETAAKRPQKPQCLFLSILPLKIRFQIYRLLLTKVYMLDSTATWVGNKADMHNNIVFTESAREKCDLHATILRTCRTIYTETLPILYGDNIFSFMKPWEIHKFRDVGLVRKRSTNDPSTLVPSFNLQVTPNGRFTMVKKLYLKLTHDVITKSNMTWQQLTVEKWRYIVFVDQVEQGDAYISFPALEVLLLDFGDWALGVNDALVTGPFILKFRGSAGLEKATIKGVKNERTLRELEQGLLRDGGQFIAIS